MSSAAAAGAVTPILVAVRAPAARARIGELLTAAGYRALLTGDALEALRLAQAGQPKLVIADAQLQRISGGSLFETLRRTPEHCFTPFVLYTDGPEVPHPNDDPSVAISAWLFPPIDAEHLLALVSSLAE